MIPYHQTIQQFSIRPNQVRFVPDHPYNDGLWFALLHTHGLPGTRTWFDLATGSMIASQLTGGVSYTYNGRKKSMDLPGGAEVFFTFDMPASGDPTSGVVLAYGDNDGGGSARSVFRSDPYSNQAFNYRYASRIANYQIAGGVQGLGTPRDVQRGVFAHRSTGTQTTVYYHDLIDGNTYNANINGTVQWGVSQTGFKIGGVGAGQTFSEADIVFWKRQVPVSWLETFYNIDDVMLNGWLEPTPTAKTFLLNAGAAPPTLVADIFQSAILEAGE